MTAEENILSEITTPGPPSDPGLPIWHKFLACEAASPESLALVSMYQSPDLYGLPSLSSENGDSESHTYLRWTYTTLKSAVARLVTGLQEIGVDKGTPIISFLPLGAEGVLGLWAAEVLDCIWVPLNARSLANTTEITHMVRTALSVATPGKQPLVLAQDAETARRIDGLGLKQLKEARKLIVVVDQTASSSGWDSFSEVMNREEVTENVLCGGGYQSSFVVFTSGTTSLPKGVHATPLTHFERYLDRLAASPQFAGQSPPRALCAGPANHVPGRYQQVWPLCLGGAAVFAAPAFDLESTATALVEESITHVTLVPTMVLALAGALQQPLSHLREVRVGSAGVSSAVVRACINQLSASRVQVGYGMTEGLYIFSGLAPPEELIDIDRDEVAVGWPEPGCAVKICHHETGATLPRGQAGVVHWSGPTAARAYIGGDTAGVCYMDADGQPWLNTGDLGRIDDRGRLFLTGRHKDMIIRGGENISPAAMEAALNTDPSVAARRPQVVGAPDEVAGHVPIVVVLGTVDDSLKKTIRNILLAKMGLTYLPDDVVALADLGLVGMTDYPLTTSGKIHKVRLQELVVQRRTAVLKKELEDARDAASVVRQAWSRATGLDATEVDLDAPIVAFADSITLMRVRSEIKRSLGTAPSMVEILRAQSIRALISLAEALKPLATEQSSGPKREGPPTAEDIVYLALDDADGSQMTATQTAVSKALEGYDLAWDDVEDITPAYDFPSIQWLHAEYESWIYRYGYVIRNKSTDRSTLRRMIEVTLAHHRMLASFLLADSAVLGGRDLVHVLMRQSPTYLNRIIEDGGEIATVSALRDLVYVTQDDLAAYPGPMARFVLYTIAETGQSAFLLVANHCVIDASSVELFAGDLDQALAQPDHLPRPQRVDYKIWADSYFSLRSSLPAQSSVAFHASRLADLSAHYAAAAFPPPSVVSDDAVRAQHRAAKPPQPNFYTERFPLAAFETIRRHQSAVAIKVSVVVKAALVLFNARKTAHTHALFAAFESNRSRFSSFLPPTVAVTQEGADVAGPTYAPVINLINVPRDETVSSFLQRLAEESALLTSHASIPWYALEAALGPDSGHLIPTISALQMYNWLGPIGGGQAFSHVEPVAALFRPKMGIHVVSGEDRDNGEVFVFVDGDAYGTLDEYKAITVELGAILRWIVDEKNWDKPVGDVI